MIVIEYKARTKPPQVAAIDAAIRTAGFVRNKCLRLWMDAKDSDTKVGKYDLYKYTTQLRKEFEWAGQLNSTAVQAASERAWAAISRFYDRVKTGQKPVGYPKFKSMRSVEYKQSGWKVEGKSITFTDKNNIGKLRLIGTNDIHHYPEDLIRRVRLLKRADGYYVQFVVDIDRVVDLPPTGNTVGIDVGLESFYTDSHGTKVENPRFYRKAEVRIKKASRSLSRKKRGSNNRRKSTQRLAKAHLKVSRQRKDFVVKQANHVMQSNDFVVCEDLKVRNMVRNSRLAKSISDAGWSIFRQWLQYYAEVYGRVYTEIPPHYTSRTCSSCGVQVVKTLSERVHSCSCGAELDRDHNAALNILRMGLNKVGQGVPKPNAWGEDTSTTGVQASVASNLVEPRIS